MHYCPECDEKCFCDGVEELIRDAAAECDHCDVGDELVGHFSERVEEIVRKYQESRDAPEDRS
jgi:hypothetical protein